MPFFGFDDYFINSFNYAIEREKERGDIKMDKKYKVGTEVILKNDLEIDKRYGSGVVFVSELEKYKKEPIKIIDYSTTGYYTNSGWFICDEMIDHVCNMPISEVVEALINGKKIRKSDWSEEEYIYYNTKLKEILDEEDNYYGFNADDLICDKWELYKEPTEDTVDKIEKVKDYCLSTGDLGLLYLLDDLKSTVNKLVDAYNKEK